MPRFAFQARSTTGDSVSGIGFAVDEQDLDRQLASADLLLIKARAVRAARGRTSSNRTLVDFCYHMSVVVEAGIPLLRGLSDLAQGEHPLRDTIGDVARKIESGAALSEALADFPEHFPPLILALIRAGEQSGNLDRVLRDLARYFEWRENLRRQIVSAVTYPSLVMVAVIGLCALLTTWVLPRFLQIFIELGVSLPPTTRAMLSMHQFLGNWGWHLLGLCAALAIGGFPVIRSRRGRRVLDRVVLRTPLLGSLVLMIEMSRFSHNLGLLYGTGVAIVKALELIEEIAQNSVVSEMMGQARERIEKGGSLSDAFGRSALLPPLVARMISVGEASGRLDESLERASSYYDREVPAIISRLVALFNTGVLIFLGGTLVVVALSIFIPFYQMMGNLSATQP
jgi:type IV pilus assembly protein PilC